MSLYHYRKFTKIIIQIFADEAQNYLIYFQIHYAPIVKVYIPITITKAWIQDPNRLVFLLSSSLYTTTVALL